jgi:hypothetical protein
MARSSCNVYGFISIFFPGAFVSRHFSQFSSDPVEGTNLSPSQGRSRRPSILTKMVDTFSCFKLRRSPRSANMASRRPRSLIQPFITQLPVHLSTCLCLALVLQRLHDSIPTPDSAE